MNDTSKAKACPRCGGPVPSAAAEGLCTRCLLSTAVGGTEGPGLHRGPIDVPAMERVAAAFPQLEILELIGAGGMGAVFKARQPRLDRMVALKLLPEALGKDPAFTERFLREARVLARLSHPHIVAVYDFGESGGLYYLLMEYVDGVNLRQAMRTGRFTPAQALSLVPQICDALQFAHESGVMHRDIKPENILLDTKGQVKLADFGIAKLLTDGSRDPGLTVTGAAIGTPQYMAPEQIERPADVDHRADIYSLGVVFYELLTGELPIGRFAAPSSKTPLDARVDDIVLRALAKERELRQQSAREVRTAVEGLGGVPPTLPDRKERRAEPPIWRTSAGYRGKVVGLMALLSVCFVVNQGPSFARVLGDIVRFLGALDEWPMFLAAWIGLGAWAWLIGWGWRAGRGLFTALEPVTESGRAPEWHPLLSRMVMALVGLGWAVVGLHVVYSLLTPIFASNHPGVGLEALWRNLWMLGVAPAFVAITIWWTARESRRAAAFPSAPMPTWSLRMAMGLLVAIVAMDVVLATYRSAGVITVLGQSTALLPACVAIWSGHRGWRGLAMAMTVMGLASAVSGAAMLSLWMLGLMPSPFPTPDAPWAQGGVMGGPPLVVMFLGQVGVVVLQMAIWLMLSRASVRRGFGLGPADPKDAARSGQTVVRPA